MRDTMNMYDGYSDRDALSSRDLREASGTGRQSFDVNSVRLYDELDTEFAYQTGRVQRVGRSSAYAQALSQAQESGYSVDDVMDGVYD